MAPLKRPAKRPAKHPAGHQNLLREGEYSASDRMTPPCALCGEKHVSIATEATIMLRGQWFPSTEYDTPVFLLDPDSQLVMLEMPNGQIALVTDQLSGNTQHAHMECLETLVDDNEDDDDDDDDAPDPEETEYDRDDYDDYYEEF